MKVIKNYIYNTLYQFMIVIIPFITMPYLTRVLTVDQIGINSYTLSIVNYFSLFGVLGMTMYGNRQIAYCRDDKEKMNQVFWSLFITKVFTCIIAILLYYIFIYYGNVEYKKIYEIQGIYLIGAMIDISWLYTGIEDFKKVVLRDSATKIIGVIAIFTLVKSNDDFVLYILITALANLAGMIIMWAYLPKEIKKVDFKIKLALSHIKPLIMLFIPQVALQVYGLLSRTMIGNLSTNDQVAIYDYSQKFVQITLSFISSIGIVLMPRIANIMSNEGKEKVKEVVSKSFLYVSYIAFPICFGLFSVANTFISWFLGKEFSEVGPITSLSSIIIIAVSWANVIGVQYLISSYQENKYTISIIISAIVNIVLNFIIIRPLGALGATISLIIAEFLGTIIQIILVRKELDIKFMLTSVIKYFISSILMAIVIIIVTRYLNPSIITNFIQVILGVIIYMGFLFILRDRIQLEFLSKIKDIIIKKRSM